MKHSAVLALILACASARAQNSQDALAERYFAQGVMLISKMALLQAEEMFHKSLMIRPDYYVDDHISPKIRDVFLEARRRLVNSNTYQARFSPSVSINRTDESTTITVHISPEAIPFISKVHLFMRSLEQADYRFHDMEKDGSSSWHVVLDTKAAGASPEHYFVGFLGRYRTYFLTIGSEQSPRTLPGFAQACETPKILTTEHSDFSLWPLLALASTSALGVLGFACFFMTL